MFLVYTKLMSCVCSVLGHKISPLRKGHFYSLTKHAITTLTEIVRQELREDDSGIRVTVSWHTP